MKFMLEQNLLGYEATYRRLGFTTSSTALAYRPATSTGWQEDIAMHLPHMLAVLAALKGQGTVRI